MPNAQELKQRIEDAIPGASAEVEDLTGGGDHFRAVVVSAISEWPTIPQLFVNGKLVGGADIVTEMYETGELAQALGVEAPEAAPTEAPAAEAPGPAPMGIENRLG